MEEYLKRFYKHVNKTDTCWLWTASKFRNGYGQTTYNKQPMGSHRISWLLAGNNIPEGHVIRHKCRNKHCVNPEHLETGTLSENTLDRRRDGTDNRGVRNNTTKLTDNQVREIRTRSTELKKDLAHEYGVSDVTISYIILGKTWKHLL